MISAILNSKKKKNLPPLTRVPKIYFTFSILTLQTPSPGNKPLVQKSLDNI